MGELWIYSRPRELQVQSLNSTANRKHGTRSVRHNIPGRGMGQVGNRCSLHSQVGQHLGIFFTRCQNLMAR
jgi:hypothetical protein